MAKPKYWTHLFQDDDDETTMSTVSPLVTLSSAVRSINDTYLRAIVWAHHSTTVTLSSPIPSVDWLAGATVEYLFFFDTESDAHAVNLIDDDPYTVGYMKLTPGPIFQMNSTNYSVHWHSPPIGLGLEGGRQGYSASNLPSFSAQRWVSDNHGVFDNFAGFHVQHSSRLRGRVLWASELPPGP